MEKEEHSREDVSRDLKTFRRMIIASIPFMLKAVKKTSIAVRGECLVCLSGGRRTKQVHPKTRR